MNTHIGYIGLGKMGKNMVLRLQEHGWTITATDANAEARAQAQAEGIEVQDTLADVVSALEGPRTIWLMVPHQVVDTVLEELTPLLAQGDTIIDGGNSNFNHSMRRAKELKGRSIHFIDAGVSGGPKGAREGACVMVGGEKEIVRAYDKLFQDIAAPNAYQYMGDPGAGHFVKMVHNGIEYGMMQAIAEGFALMQASPLHIDLLAAAKIYNNKSVIESRLTGWLESAYEQYGIDLKEISGEIAHSGEGLWTVQTAHELNIPVPVIEDSLKFREDSQGNPSYTGQVVSALRNQFGGHDVKK